MATVPVSLGVRVLSAADGALTEVPCYEPHKRGKNWAAVITVDPTAPAGLKRRFLQRAHGDYFYMVSDLHVGDAVEFGGDYYSGSGKKHSNRFYGVVLSIGDDYVSLDEYKTGNAACKAAAAQKAAAPQPPSYNETLAKALDSSIRAAWQCLQDHRRIIRTADYSEEGQRNRRLSREMTIWHKSTLQTYLRLRRQAKRSTAQTAAIYAQVYGA